MAEVLLGKYELSETIGHGSFGEVRKAINLENGQVIAIKFERTQAASPNVLFNESQTLSQLQGGLGIPKLYAFGKHEDADFMVTELLGDNLLTLYRHCGKGFSIETLAKIATQALDRVEFIHNRGYLHRDIKPENLLVGSTDQDLIFLTDFGLAKKYMNREFQIHIPFKEDRCFTGTLTYASLNMHMGFQLSRRDDLQSLFFVLLFFLKGKLPWQTGKEKSIVQKMLMTPAELCEGFPDQFRQALVYIRSLQFEERPNYAHLKGLFSLWNQPSIHFDWLEMKPIRKKGRSLTNTGQNKSLFRTTERMGSDTSGKVRSHSRSPGKIDLFQANIETTPIHKTVTFNLDLNHCPESSGDSGEETVKGTHLPSLDRKKLKARFGF